MEITETLTDSQGRELAVRYCEDDPCINAEDVHLKDVHAFCFCGDQLVIVFHGDRKSWQPPGGGIEPGETYEEAVVREVKEETNMKVVHHELIGYMDIFDPDGTVRQTRSFCRVESCGPFESDPDGDITEINLIDPEDYRDYFEWQEIGEHLMLRARKLGEKY